MYLILLQAAVISSKMTSEQIYDMKNMYKTEKALHEAMNAATANLKHANQLKESLKVSPTLSKSTAHSNVSNKRPRSIKIIEAMRSNAKSNNRRFQKEHWQKVHHELMESNATKLHEAEAIYNLQYECVDCLDTKICETWGTCQKCNIPKQCVELDPSKIVKDFQARRNARRT